WGGSEGGGRGRDSSLDPGCPLHDRPDAAPAVDRVDVGGSIGSRSDQQATTEAPDVVERDPVGERTGRKRGEGPRLATRVDHDDAGRSHLERVDVVPAKGTARTGHPSPARERAIRRRAGVRGVPPGVRSRSCEAYPMAGAGKADLRSRGHPWMLTATCWPRFATATPSALEPPWQAR